MVYRMITVISFFCILSTLLLSQVIYFDNFAVTDSKYLCTSDWNEIINNLFGEEYRVADWNDIKEYYNSGGNLSKLLDELGLSEYQSEISITLNGDPLFSSSRYYFLSRHDHNKPSGYLAHENIDNFLVSLGSWNGERKILAIKKDIENSYTQEYGIIYKNFGLTGQKYSYNSNWDEIILNVFGTEYRVADWQDLINFYSAGENIEDLMNGLSLNEYRSEAFIKLYDDPTYNSKRAYYISIHNHVKPNDYFAHQTIDNHLIDLGSWDGKRPILVIKNN